MNVLIIDRKSLQLAASVEVNLATIDQSEMALKEYFDLAWRSAVADGNVQADNRHLYQFAVDSFL